ncbi:MAG TPA: cupin domain-containing protein [Caulobacteraceae bacterium]|jgi:quercetin dioxygenase-like cupin family protein
MPFVDIGQLVPFEKGVGWRARLFHSETMTISHWEFDGGATVHPHFHPQEEVWEILSGAVEVTIDGVSQIARPGVAAVVPPNVIHSVRVIEAGTAVVIDHPLRLDFAPGSPP